MCGTRGGSLQWWFHQQQSDWSEISEWLTCGNYEFNWSNLYELRWNFRWYYKTRCPLCHSSCTMIKTPPCLKSISVKHWPTFCSPSPTKVMSPYGYKKRVLQLVKNNIQPTSFCTDPLSYENKTFREKKFTIYLLVYIICNCMFFYRSIYHLTMLAVPHLTKTQGSIVNVSSVNGIRSVSWYFLWLIHAHYYQWLWNTGDSRLLELWSIKVTCIDLSK